MYHVYAHCFGNCRYLKTVFTGSRYQCGKFIRDAARAGRPTHFMFVSKLDYEAATRRYE